MSWWVILVVALIGFIMALLSQANDARAEPGFWIMIFAAICVGLKFVFWVFG